MKKKPARHVKRGSPPKKAANKCCSLFNDNQEWFIVMGSCVIISLLVFYLFGLFGPIF